MYNTDGKFRAHEIIEYVLTEDGQTLDYGTLWGGGRDARRMQAAGFRVSAFEDGRAHDGVPAAERRRQMEDDGMRCGYETVWGDAGQSDLEFDAFYADYCGPADDDKLMTTRSIAQRTRRYLFITLSPSREKNPEMQGESGIGTVPSWMCFAAPGFALMYITRYRSRVGHQMWFACLVRQEIAPRARSGKMMSLSQPDPFMLSTAISTDGFWVHRQFAGRFHRERLRMVSRRCANPACRKELPLSTHPNRAYCVSDTGDRRSRCLRHAEYLHSLAPVVRRICQAQGCNNTIDQAKNRNTKFCGQRCCYKEWARRRQKFGGVVAP